MSSTESQGRGAASRGDGRGRKAPSGADPIKEEGAPAQNPEVHAPIAPPPLASGPPIVRQAHMLVLWGNVILAVIKLIAGFALASPALIADGWHSAADTLSSLVALVGYRIGREPADEDHHFGHGNHEALAGLIIGLSLMIGGALLLWNSLTGDEGVLGTRGLELAMIVALISTLVNLGMAAVTNKAAKSVHSISLRALTLDNLGDALSSLIVLVAIGLRHLGYPQVELFVAGAIGVVIAAMGLSSVRSALDVLLVRVADQTLRGRIAEAARALPGVRGVQDVRIHPLGSEMRVDLEINVDGHLTVTEGHDIAHHVMDELTSSFRQVKGVHVHVNPCLVVTGGDTMADPFAELRGTRHPSA